MNPMLNSTNNLEQPRIFLLVFMTLIILVAASDTKNSELPIDVSQSYLKWSQWQRMTVHERLQNQSRQKYKNGNRKPKGIQENAVMTTSPMLVDPYIHKNHVKTISNESYATEMPITDNYSLPIPQQQQYTLTGAVIISILTILVSLVTICGNILVLVSFFVERALRTATNYFIASLAVTDLLIGIFSMNLYTLYLILGRWPLGRLSCDLWLSLDHTACLTSQYTVLIITIDRFFSVKIPAKYRNWRTDTKVNIMVAATWIIPSGVFFPLIMAWPYFNSTAKSRLPGECYAEFSSDPVFNTIFTLCYFWVTLFVMCGLYVGIYRVAVKLQQKSDEKRGRIDTVRFKKGTSQMDVTNNMSTIDKNKSTKGKDKPASNSSLLDPNDSSAFDSDEINKKRFSNVKTITQNKIITKSGEINLLYDSLNNKKSFNLKELQNKSNNILPMKDCNTLSNGKALQFENSHSNYHASNLETNMIYRPECPFHGERFDSDKEECGLRPVSVYLREQLSQQIASPILTDDESSVEYCIKEKMRRISYLPSSPALCICSDLEDEWAIDNQFCPSLWNCPNSSPKQATSWINDSMLMKERCEEKAIGNNVEVAQPNQASVDPDYQKRVLEMFKKRIAGPSVSASECKLRFNDDVFHTETSNNTSELASSYNRSNNVEREAKHDSRQSPVWRTKSFQELHTFSTASSIQDVTYQNELILVSPRECIHCLDQQYSESTNSSLSENYSSELIEKRCFCYSIGIRPVSQKNKEHSGSVYQGIKRLSGLRLHVVTAVKTKLESLKNRKKSKTERGRRENRARKALRTITFILGAFVLCWTPYHIVIMIKGICDDVESKYTCVAHVLYVVSYWLCYMNSPINPFCYALANAQFKKTFIRIFHGDFRRT